MYAVIRTGGKQYKVKAGDLVKVEKLEKSLGDEFDMDEVLLVSGQATHVGEPTIAKAKVTAVVTQQGKAAKIIVFKKKRRQGYRKLNGHRQCFTELFIKAISSPDGEVDSSSKQAPVRDIDSKKETVVAAPSPEKKVTAKKATSKKSTAKKSTAKKAKAKKG